MICNEEITLVGADDNKPAEAGSASFAFVSSRGTRPGRSRRGKAATTRQGRNRRTRRWAIVAVLERRRHQAISRRRFHVAAGICPVRLPGQIDRAHAERDEDLVTEAPYRGKELTRPTNVWCRKVNAVALIRISRKLRGRITTSA